MAQIKRVGDYFDWSRNRYEEPATDITDEMFEQAKNLVIDHQRASATFLQRKLVIGYARAAKLLELLEEKRIVGPAIGAKPREVYLGK